MTNTVDVLYLMVKWVDTGFNRILLRSTDEEEVMDDICGGVV